MSSLRGGALEAHLPLRQKTLAGACFHPGAGSPRHQRGVGRDALPPLPLPRETDSVAAQATALPRAVRHPQAGRIMGLRGERRLAGVASRQSRVPVAKRARGEGALHYPLCIRTALLWRTRAWGRRRAPPLSLRPSSNEGLNASPPAQPRAGGGSGRQVGGPPQLCWAYAPPWSAVLRFPASRSSTRFSVLSRSATSGTTVPDPLSISLLLTTPRSPPPPPNTLLPTHIPLPPFPPPAGHPPPHTHLPTPFQLLFGCRHPPPLLSYPRSPFPSQISSSRIRLRRSFM